MIFYIASRKISLKTYCNCYKEENSLFLNYEIFRILISSIVMNLKPPLYLDFIKKKSLGVLKYHQIKKVSNYFKRIQCFNLIISTKKECSKIWKTRKNYRLSNRISIN